MSFAGFLILLFLPLLRSHHFLLNADWLSTPTRPTRPGITLDLTTDLSKYHAVRFDQQLAAGNVTVDSIAFQTVDRFPGWDAEGALLHYAPNGFDMIYPPMRDVRAAFYGILTVGWSGKWNTDKVRTGTAGPYLPLVGKHVYGGRLTDEHGPLIAARDHSASRVPGLAPSRVQGQTGSHHACR